MLWDIFCRVIDNHGDLGVCWRLSADLAARGESVRLWVDDPAALAWMAPGGAPGVQLIAWQGELPALQPGDIVIEAFGCDPPADFIERMQRPRPPLWINLEYLSAEDWVERSHGLQSPVMSGPGRGLCKWFVFPGFTPRTGGLLREPGLIARLDACRQATQRAAWLARRACAPLPGESVVTLFGYDYPPAPALLAQLKTRPTLLLVAAGLGRISVEHALGRPLPSGTTVADGALRVHALPHLPQTVFDELLACSDLNFVRGEDSFVRAQWAGRPFVWLIYPQHDGVHADKLDAFLLRYTQGWPAARAAALRQLWRWWNALEPAAPPALEDLLHGPNWEAWTQAALAWRERLLQQPDLATYLLGFAAGHLAGQPA